MEGGNGDENAYYQPYQNLPNNFAIYQQGPPLTAINRFLWSDQHQFSPQQSVANTNENIFTQHGGFYEFNNSASGNISDANEINSWTSNFPEPSLMDNILFNEQNALQWNNEEQEMVISSPKNSKETGKKAKEGTSSTTLLVKGQWTEEEDRNLMKLVKQFGMKKWAQIAENMVRRAGKQCRERWHNHLRPDIKKDMWSEEEEVLLVEAHKQIGNKWAEIGKRIPGRTENAIKNHWNATKRRQISRRNKLKKQEKEGQNESKYKSSILQDYIRRRYFSDDSPPPANTMISTPSGNMINAIPPYSDDDDSPSSLITNQTYDEEMNFMQNLFGNNSLVENNNGKVVDSYGCNSYVGSSSEANMRPMVADQSYNAMNSANYLSYLVDHSTNAMNSMNVAAAGSSSSGRNKDIDLMEMVSSSIYPQNNSNNTFF